MKKEKRFTVCGYHEDNGQIWVRWTHAKDWMRAIENAIKQIKKDDSSVFYSDIIIGSVFPGWHKDEVEHFSVCTAKDFLEIAEGDRI